MLCDDKYVLSIYQSSSHSPLLGLTGLPPSSLLIKSQKRSPMLWQCIASALLIISNEAFYLTHFCVWLPSFNVAFMSSPLSPVSFPPGSYGGDKNKDTWVLWPLISAVCPRRSVTDTRKSARTFERSPSRAHARLLAHVAPGSRRVAGSARAPIPVRVSGPKYKIAARRSRFAAVCHLWSAINQCEFTGGRDFGPSHADIPYTQTRRGPPRREQHVLQVGWALIEEIKRRTPEWWIKNVTIEQLRARQELSPKWFQHQCSSACFCR